jgi:hypothetical protein
MNSEDLNHDYSHSHSTISFYDKNAPMRDNKPPGYWDDEPENSMTDPKNDTLGDSHTGMKTTTREEKLGILIEELREREANGHVLGRVPVARPATWERLAAAFRRGYASAEASVMARAAKRRPINVSDDDAPRIARQWATEEVASWVRRDLRAARRSLPDPRMRGGRVASAADYVEVFYFEGKLNALKAMATA